MLEKKPRRWPIMARLTVISQLGLAGMLILGGIGYWGSRHQAETATVAFEQTLAKQKTGIWNLLLKASSFRVSPGIPPC